MLNYNHLHYFYRTAELGSVTAAAKSFQIAQPSLSIQLKNLEGSMGKPLFQRRGRKLVLTDFGHHVFGFCKQIFEAGDSLQASLKSGTSQYHQKVHLGLSEEIDRPFIVEVFSSFLKRGRGAHAPLALRMGSSTHIRLIHALKAREIDVVVSHAPSYDAELSVALSVHIPVVFTAPGGGAATPRVMERDKAVSFIRDGLKKSRFDWALPAPGFRLRQEVDHFLETKKIDAKPILESEALAGVSRAVSYGLGVALLPSLFLGQQWKRLPMEIVAPAEGFWKHALWVLCRKEDVGSEIVREIIRSFEAFVESPPGSRNWLFPGHTKVYV